MVVLWNFRLDKRRIDAAEDAFMDWNMHVSGSFSFIVRKFNLIGDGDTVRYVELLLFDYVFFISSYF